MAKPFSDDAGDTRFKATPCPSVITNEMLCEANRAIEERAKELKAIVMAPIRSLTKEISVTHKCETYEMPFGKYKGETLLDISNSDEGLKYLDWLLSGEIDLRPATQEALEEFVALPHIEREMERVIG